MKQCTVDVEIDVYDLAREFVEIGSVDQAKFFSLVADRFGDWRPSEVDDQLREIARELAPDGKSVNWLRRLVAFIDDSEER